MDHETLPDRDIQARFQFALGLHQVGQKAAARDAYRALLAQAPSHFGALYASGLIELETGDATQALDLMSRAVAVNPGDAPAHFNRGAALHALARYEEAAASFATATRLDVTFYEAHESLGRVLQHLGQHEAAQDSYGKALSIRPTAELFHERGIILQSLRRPLEALACLDAALALKPNKPDVLSNRAAVLHTLGRFEDSIASCDQAIAIRPEFADAHNNRAVALHALKRPDEALESYDRAIALNPQHAGALYNRAGVLLWLKRPHDALESYRRVVEISPDYPFAKGHYLHAKALCAEWSDFDQLTRSVGADVLARKLSAEPFGFQGVSDSEAELRACAEIYARNKYPPIPGLALPPRPPGAKIRLGYLCGEFRNQATSILMAELFELHDKDRFEVYAFDNGWDDRSFMRARLKAAFNEIIDISTLPDEAAAEKIAAMGIDALVNLNGYFGRGRPAIFARRPAPVQVNYLGFPGTLGADYMDYLIADRVVIPPASRTHYNETVAYLPHCYQANDRKRLIADRVFTRTELGLPPEGVVFCCFNNPYKILPHVFDVWMRILAEVPGSTLWLIENAPVASHNLRAEAAKRGIDPLRLVFAGRAPVAEHLARHRLADLFLDTLPYNAHTTASDALWAGLPVLTCTGNTFAGRVGTSLLRALDLPELITTSLAEYEEMAVALAHDPARLSALKRKLADHRLSTYLFDTPRFARHIEDAYAQMVARQRAGLPPAPIEVLP